MDNDILTKIIVVHLDRITHLYIIVRDIKYTY